MSKDNDLKMNHHQSRKKENEQKSPPDAANVKSEIDRINAQTVTNEEIKALEKAAQSNN